MPRKAAVRGGWAASPPESSGSVSLLRAGLQPLERRSGCGEWWEAGTTGEGGGRWRKVAYPRFGAGVIGTWGEREDRQ